MRRFEWMALVHAMLLFSLTATSIALGVASWRHAPVPTKIVACKDER